MGTGSSRAKNLTVQKAHSSEHGSDVVANVNRSETETLSPTTQSTIVEKQVNSKNPGLDVLISNERDRTFQFQTSDKNNSKKEGYTEHSKRNSNSVRTENNVVVSLSSDAHTELVFENDSDLDDNIDEVLKIPVAVGKSRLNQDNEKKIQARKNDVNKYFNNFTRESDTNPSKVSTDSQSTLPETYVQRMQRQQYKFQHKLLLHDKEDVRNPRDWQQDNEENKITDSHHVQFDATKFRAANKGTDPKKDLFTTEPKDLETIHDDHQPSQQSFDDFEWTAKEDTLIIKQLPQYNQSELDLMKQLEDEAL